MTSFRRLFLLGLFLAAASLAVAGPFSAVVVYGDSLSDNGNLYGVVGQPGPPWYAVGRASNGPLAVEDLAAKLGTPLFDYAFGGATTGIGNHLDGGNPTHIVSLPGMQTMFLSTELGIKPLAPTALFVVWGGPDDFLSPSPLDAGDPLAIANRAVGDIVGIVNGLIADGAKNILVPGLPDLGLTPYLQNPAFSALTDYFNGQLLSQLPAGVKYFDTAGLMRQMVLNPGAYGLTNVTDACTDAATYVCSNPNQYMFYDDFHPSARVHQIAADALYATVTPEPSSAVLVLGAAGVLVLARLRKRA